MHHPIVGDLDLTFESLGVSSRSGLALITYIAVPGSPSDDSLQLLAHWAATKDAASVKEPRTTEP